VAIVLSLAKPVNLQLQSAITELRMKKNEAVVAARETLAALGTSNAPTTGRLLNPKEVAYRKLKEDILLGRHAFGAVLSPRKLGQEMGMSFLPVADALRVLEGDGLVETRDRVGTRVKIPTVEDITGVYTLREALESQAARLCARRVTEQQASQLKSMAREVDYRYSRCEREHDSREFWIQTSVFHANFHRFIAECAGCPMLTRAIENSQVLTFKLLFDSAIRTKKRPPRWHQSLVKAILSGDPQAADTAAREHISYGVGDVLQCLDALRLEKRWRTPIANDEID
jgi:GntR family transcriptional regulator, rspAB operon transcriptional repressor